MRRKTRQIRLGGVSIGGGAPVSVQSMTNTDTKDISATLRQAKRLKLRGCEILRLAVRDTNSAEAIARIKSKISMPVEADIHFDYRLALLAIASGADGIRLNPGNITKPAHLKEVISECKKAKIPVRIGVNSGSLPKTAKGKLPEDKMVKAALSCAGFFQKQGFYDIMLSLKSSDVATTINAYRKAAKRCDYPLHLGVTATGHGDESIIKSAIGIGTLLSEGIGDTIRVSLTGDPAQEVIIAKEILQALGLRYFRHEVIACPTCGRCQVDLIKIVKDFKRKLSTACPVPERSKWYGVNCELSTKQSFKIALMGCEVNGPGEAKEADIGIAFGKNSGILFKKGKIVKKVKAGDAVKELLKHIDKL